jgi:hypothetical protein
VSFSGIIHKNVFESRVKLVVKPKSNLKQIKPTKAIYFTKIIYFHLKKKIKFIIIYKKNTFNKTYEIEKKKKEKINAFVFRTKKFQLFINSKKEEKTNR